MSDIHPNILLITSDQQRGTCLDFAPDCRQTPNLDWMCCARAAYYGMINFIDEQARVAGWSL